MPHTKGPFVLGDMHKSPVRVLAAGNTGHALAMVYLTDPNTKKRTPEFIGNAHLFAASPAMLAALKGFVEACGGNPPDWLKDEYAAAEDAIAEAEGRANG